MKIKEINKEDREFILFAFGLLNKARYASFDEITNVYNRVFGTNLKVTNCATCIRQRVLDLKKELDKIIEKEKDASSQNISTSNEKNENNELNGKEVNQSQEVKESDSLEGMEQPKKENTITKTKRSKK